MTAENIKTIATHMDETGDTVRRTAEIFKVSKSTIHKNMTQNLKYVDPMLYKKVGEVLKRNKSERHIRGGMATREKYRKLKEN